MDARQGREPMPLAFVDLSFAEAPMLRRFVLTSVFSVILVALATALSEEAQGERRCTSTSPTELTVEALHAEPRFSDEKTFGELEVVGDWWSIPHAERNAHPLLIVSTRVEQQVIVADAGAREIEPGVYCPAPRSVLIRLNFVDRWIVVAHEATIAPHGDACVASMLHEHGERIIRTEDQALIVFARTFDERFGDDLKALKQIPGPSEAETQAQFASGIRSVVEQAVLGLIARRNAIVSQDIDSPEEMQRLRSACDGMVGRAQAAIARAR
jgi:hypothetical protein